MILPDGNRYPLTMALLQEEEINHAKDENLQSGCKTL